MGESPGDLTISSCPSTDRASPRQQEALTGLATFSRGWSWSSGKDGPMTSEMRTDLVVLLSGDPKPTFNDAIAAKSNRSHELFFATVDRNHR
jgi:hypothetical protein